MSDSTLELPLFDVTARKVHQWAMVGLIVIAFVVQGSLAVALLALAGLVMLIGRYWWPADVFRQLTWRVLEPAGVLTRNEVHEDHDTRRLARVIGGACWLVSALLLTVGVPVVAWVIALAIAVMVVLDAAVSFCVLCYGVALVHR
ncbi:MAG TPA: DUF4395 family protein [Candidatus Dormibacteraeota bacterium]|nr:DUF4395 family protein [Candidatus Dormibacteraeota bacterium]